MLIHASVANHLDGSWRLRQILDLEFRCIAEFLVGTARLDPGRERLNFGGSILLMHGSRTLVSLTHVDESEDARLLGLDEIDAPLIAEREEGFF